MKRKASVAFKRPPPRKKKTEAGGASEDSASGLLREILALAIENETLRKFISDAESEGP